MSEPDYRDLPPLSKAEMAKVTKPEKWSQSIVSKWDSCHRSAFLYRKHRGGPQTHPMMRGTAFHHFVAEATNLLIDQGENRMPGDVGKDLMQSILDECEIVEPGAADDGSDRRTLLVLPEYEQDACRLMAYNWAEATIIDPDLIVGIEQMLELEIDGFTIRGKLDFAQISPLGYAEVVDYKTSLSMPSRDEVENGAKGFQLKFYAALMFWGKPEGEALGLGEGMNEVRASLSFPRFTDESTGELFSREVSFTRTDLNDFRSTLASHLRKLDAAFDSGRFQAVDGAHCSECPARSECPLPDALHDLPPVETLEDAIAVAKRVDFRDADQRADRKALREFCDTNGISPFAYSDDYVYEFKPEFSRVVNWKEVGDGPINREEHVSARRSTKFHRRRRTAEEKKESADA